MIEKQTILPFIVMRKPILLHQSKRFLIRKEKTMSDGRIQTVK